MIEPLFNFEDGDWVNLVGRYILNMGGVEAATRLLIMLREQTDDAPAINADLPSRLGYLRKRFPREPKERHQWAMNVFAAADRHVSFRNIVAHSPIAIVGYADGSRHIAGILNLQPNDKRLPGEVVGATELRTRVDESAAISRDLLMMQPDYEPEPSTR